MPLAARLTQFGHPSESLTIAEIQPVSPGPGEVRLDMLAAPINPADINVIEGKYGELPELPAIIGNEGAGRVAELGPGVAGPAPGTLVLPMSFGTWTQSMTVRSESVVSLPPGTDIRQAAMLTVNPATAWRLLHDFETLKPGDWIVQNAANSGVGRSVIKIARALGLRTLNLVRRQELVAELTAEGGDAVLLEDCDLRKEARAICGKSLPKLALNAVGGASALNVANALARGGTHVTFGAMSKQALKIPNGLVIFSDLRFRGFWLKRWRDNAPSAELKSMYASLAGLVAAGQLSVPVQATFPLPRIKEALEAAAGDQRAGKILIDLAGSLAG